MLVLKMLWKDAMVCTLMAGTTGFHQGFGGNRSVTGASMSQTHSLTTVYMGTNDTAKNQYINQIHNQLALAIGISFPS